MLILPGLGNCQSDYAPLKEDLEQRGFTVQVAAIARVDWLRNAAGILDSSYWKGTLQPRPTVDWYLTRVRPVPSASVAAVDYPRLAPHLDPCRNMLKWHASSTLLWLLSTRVGHESTTRWQASRAPRRPRTSCIAVLISLDDVCVGFWQSGPSVVNTPTYAVRSRASSHQPRSTKCCEHVATEVR